MKTINKVIAILVLSMFLFACEAEMIEELNIDNTADLTIDSKQNAQQSQQRTDGDDDMPGDGEGPTDGDDDMPGDGEGPTDGDDDMPGDGEGPTDGDDDMPGQGNG